MIFSGFYRVLFSAIFGLTVSVLVVLVVRAILGLDLWNSGIILAATPFGVLLGWMWSIGGLNLKHYVQAEPQTSARDEEGAIVAVEDSAIIEAEANQQAEAPITIFFDELGKATIYALLLFFAVFVFANLPGGFLLQTANQPDANAAVFDKLVVLELPLMGTVETNQIIIFIAFVGWLLFSMIAFAGIVGFLMFKGHEQVAIVRETEPTAEQLAPPPPVRALGRGAKKLAKNIRTNLPKFLGQK
jgi:hypothetical protein